MKLGYTIFYVKEVEATVAFYEKAFGLRRTFVHESGYGELDTGNTKLAFCSFALAQSHVGEFTASVAGKAPFGMEIALVTEEPEAAYQKAVSAGAVNVARPEKKPWGQTVAYVRDPNGFLVEICSPVA